MDLYERIRDIAKSKGITISQLERDLDFSRSYLSKFRTITPGSDVIKKIANYLGETADYILGDTEKSDETDETLSYEKLLTIYTRGKSNLTPEEKIRLAQIILSDRNDQ